MTHSDIAPILSRLGITALNAMQESAVAHIANNQNVVIAAPTGSGKTLAYLLPVCTLLQSDVKGIQCLILSPTRELCIQIEAVWKQMGVGHKINACYGGHAASVEVRSLSQPPALLVGTPGRILDHLKRGSFSPASIHLLVLDEFDKCLSMGFQEEMSAIIAALPPLEKRVLVSATPKLKIPSFAGIENPTWLRFTEAEQAVNEGLQLWGIEASEAAKTEALYRLLCQIGDENCLIFCNERERCETLSAALEALGIACAFFHGGMEQFERETTLIRFRNGSLRYLVSTDLAARGLDIADVGHVIHADLPTKAADFLQRNGRTARMHAAGRAYVFLRKKEDLPPFIPSALEWLELPETTPSPSRSPWTTLRISGGKKDKISRGDVLGFLLQKGGLEKDEVGKIEILDYASFAAVKTSKAKGLIGRLQGEKLKGKRYKIGMAHVLGA